MFHKIEEDDASRPVLLGRRPRTAPRLSVTLALALSVAFGGCWGVTSDSPPGLRATRAFDGFAVYWLGERFEHWELTAVSGPDGPDGFVSLIYGDCTPHGGDEPSCTPPLDIQISALCSHLRDVARAPAWKHRRIRGAPVGTIDGAPVLFTRDAQIKVYLGESADAHAPLRPLHALRSLNHVAPVIDADGQIPGPLPGVPGGNRTCAQ